MDKLKQPTKTTKIYSIHTWRDGYWNAHSFCTSLQQAEDALYYNIANSQGPHKIVEEVKNEYE